MRRDSWDKQWFGVFDFHFGTEARMVGAKKRIRRAHNQRAFDAVCEAIQREKPNVFIWGGDNINCGPVNHHEKFNPLLLEGQRMGRDLHEFREGPLATIDSLLPKDAEKIWMYGNHEQWLWNFATENPGVSDMLDPDSWLQLRERGWKIFYKGGVSHVGHCYFVHGDVGLPGAGSRAHAAKKLVSEYKLSIRAGHLHTDQSYMDHRSLIKQVKNMHTGRIVPCLCDLDPAYSSGKPNNWCNGFNHGFALNSGEFWDQNVIIVNNKFCLNGHMYKG